MSDRYLHHEGPDGRPGQDWTGGDPVRAWLHAQLGTELRPSAEVQSRAAEREAGYREIQAEQERRERLAQLGERCIAMLDNVPPYECDESEASDRYSEMYDVARALNLLPKGEVNQ